MHDQPYFLDDVVDGVAGYAELPDHAPREADVAAIEPGERPRMIVGVPIVRVT